MSSGYCAYIATDSGVISVRLRPDLAPRAVNDFVFLAEHGFYDGLTFFEVCPDPADALCPGQAPIAVAGDPTERGTGGPGYAVPADPVDGGYLFGTVAMYGPNPAVMGSTFFISRGDSRSLSHSYDIFGQVTGGIPALAALRKGQRILWIAVVPTPP